MPGQPQPQQPAPDAPRVVTDQDKALASDWLKRINAALTRSDTIKAHKAFDRNRKLLRGIDGEHRLRVNLFYSELAAMRPALYAKDPEYAAKPTAGVSKSQLEATRKFGETVEILLARVLVKDGKLKKRAKRLVTSAYGTSVGWWKLAWQDGVKASDPLIQNRINDTQDNLQRLQTLRAQLDDPTTGTNEDLQIAQLQQTLEGLMAQVEVVTARGLTLDHVMPEDMIILDPSVREITDYERAGAIAQRVWMTRSRYRQIFGYECTKGKSYAEKGTGSPQATGGGGTSAADKRDDLLAVWEIWDHDSNRLLHVCEGEEGFCDPPTTPEWPGERWYPYFLLAFNEAEGDFFPISDVELIEQSVKDFNKCETDFAEDREDARPFTVVRKGGSLTDADVTNIRNRKGNDIVMVEGVGGQPIAHDIQTVNMGQMTPEVYDTQRARANIEMLLGGGDNIRGSVMEAKTATEAKIVAQGMQGRSGERRDVLEELLTEVGIYSLQVLLKKLTKDEVIRIAGEDAVWPEVTSPEDVFEKINLEVRGGSTGKPDQAVEQEQWTKLLPVIKDAAMQVAELREKGQNPLAEALVQLLRETLRRFDERLDLDQFLPAAPKDGQPDPQKLQQENNLMKQKGQELLDELKDLKEKEEKAYIAAAAQIATSANPLMAAQAFIQALQALQQIENGEETQGQEPDDAGMPPQAPPQGAMPQPNQPPPQP